MMLRPASHKLRVLEVLRDRYGMRVERAEWRGNEVLVKTLTTDAPEVVARFRREGEIAMRLSHPNIIPLLNRTKTQLMYPFVRGGDLRVTLNRGVLELPQALEVTRGVLAAVGHAHSRGITHLDLKPENILLEDHRARVTDFGLSHARSMPRITERGDRLGTPHYMAPEQFKGVRNDPRSDLYSIGALLFECLAGVPPYRDPLQWLAGIANERQPLPGPKALHPLLDSALARDPEARPSSVLAFLIELERAQENM